MPWKFTYEGEVYREADLTLGEIGEVCEKADLVWLHVLHPLSAPDRAWGVLGSLHSMRTGKPYPEVVATLKAMKATEFAKLYDHSDADDLPTEYADGFPPQAAESSTD